MIMQQCTEERRAEGFDLWWWGIFGKTDQLSPGRSIMVRWRATERRCYEEASFVTNRLLWFQVVVYYVQLEIKLWFAPMCAPINYVFHQVRNKHLVNALATATHA